MWLYSIFFIGVVGQMALAVPSKLSTTLSSTSDESPSGSTVYQYPRVIRELRKRFGLSGEKYRSSYLHFIKTVFDSSSGFLTDLNDWISTIESFEKIDAESIFRYKVGKNTKNAMNFTQKAAQVNTYQAEVEGSVIGLRDHIKGICFGEDHQKLLKLMYNAHQDIEITHRRFIKMKLLVMSATIENLWAAFANICEELNIEHFAELLRSAEQMAKQFSAAVSDTDCHIESEHFENFNSHFDNEIILPAIQFMDNFYRVWKSQMVPFTTEMENIQSEIITRLFDAFGSMVPQKKVKKCVRFIDGEDEIVEPPSDPFHFDMHDIAQALTEKILFYDGAEADEMKANHQMMLFEDLKSITDTNRHIYRLIRHYVNSLNSYDFELSQAEIVTAEKQIKHFPDDIIFRLFTSELEYLNNEFEKSLGDVLGLCENDESMRDSLINLQGLNENDAKHLRSLILDIVSQVEDQFQLFYSVVCRLPLKQYRETFRSIRLGFHDIELGNPTNDELKQAETIVYGIYSNSTFEELNRATKNIYEIVGNLVRIEEPFHNSFKSAVDELTSKAQPMNECDGTSANHKPTQGKPAYGILKGGTKLKKRSSTSSLKDRFHHRNNYKTLAKL